MLLNDIEDQDLGEPMGQIKVEQLDDEPMHQNQNRQRKDLYGKHLANSHVEAGRGPNFADIDLDDEEFEQEPTRNKPMINKANSRQYQN